MTVDPGTAISVSDQLEFCRIFFFTCNRHRMLFLLGLNFNTLHDLLSTVSVCLSVRTPVSNFSVYNDNSTPNYTISLGNIVIRARL